MNIPGKCSNFLMCSKFCILPSHHHPKPQKGQSKLKISGKQKSLTLKNTHLKKHTHKKWDLNPRLSKMQQTKAAWIFHLISTLFQHTTEGALALLDLLWFYKVGFFLTVIFSGNNNSGVWSRLWSSGSLASLLTATLPLLMLPVQLRWE